jgi:hypothetical protein
VRVLVVPADVYGCGFYRLIAAAEHLKMLGHDIVIQMPKEENAGLAIKLQDDEVIDVDVPEGADVIVMQRISHMWHTQVVPLLRKKGVAVVVDMDDDMSCIHRQNSAYAMYHPRSNTPYSWRHAEDSCRTATMVTVSTKPLLGIYAKHGRGMVIDNYVPESYLEIEPLKRCGFGWPGTTQSHPDDLQVVGPAVRDLVDSGLDFRVIGPPSKVRAALRLPQEPQYTGTVPLSSWADEIAKLRVSLAPLSISKFNTSKSRLKLIEASAVGVPWVASPRSEYRRFYNESGAGILADTPKQWYMGVRKLMEDDALRKELGGRGREWMQTQTIEANSWRWLEAWTRAYEIEQGSRASL